MTAAGWRHRLLLEVTGRAGQGGKRQRPDLLLSDPWTGRVFILRGCLSAWSEKMKTEPVLTPWETLSPVRRGAGGGGKTVLCLENWEQIRGARAEAFDESV